MKNGKRRIPLHEFNGAEIQKTDLTIYTYRLIGLVEYKPIAGQGDVEHCWVYLCENAQGRPVLITEAYDISWWDGPDPNNVSRDNLYELTEEPLTQPEFQHYRSLAISVGEGTLHLPITLNLPNPPLHHTMKPGVARLAKNL